MPYRKIFNFKRKNLYLGSDFHKIVNFFKSKIHLFI